MSEQVNPLADLDVEKELDTAMNREIARELMVKYDAKISNAELDLLLAECQGNPWDVPVMHQLKKIMEQMPK